MAIDTNFNASPYYDDYDEDKKFLRVLFKPGFAVQARELTQAQTIAQKQVERFGNHIFKNGSIVTGASTFLQDATYIKLNSTFGGVDVVANNFIGETILSNDESKRAEVIKVYEADEGTGDPITLMVKQLYGDAFVSTETIKTNEVSPYFASIVSTDGVGTGQVFSVTEGVFYYEGFFIKNDEQTIAISKYNNTTSNLRIGFEITESLVKNSSDTSLLDPALDASNYQAPGADRFKIDLTLTTRDIASTDTTKFIELTQIEDGGQTRSYQLPIYSVIEDTLARRTYDESGNYTVRPFNISLQTNTSNTANMDVILSPGKAYVFGYEYETISPSIITVPKPRTTVNIQNKKLSADYGNFVYTTGQFGTFPINSLSTVDLHCVPNASINLTSTASITNTKIGTARVKSVFFDSASNTSNSATYSYKTFLFDVSVGSLTGTIRSANSGNVTIGNTAAGQIFSSVTDAYKGARLRITSGSGSDESPKTITAFDATNQLITLDSNYITTPSNTSVWSIDFEFSETESLATFSGTTRVNSVDIDTRSKDPASTFNDVYLADDFFEPLVFPLGQNYITANTISDFSFSYRRLYASQSFSANDSPVLSVGSGESIPVANTTSAKQENYQVVVTSVGSSPYAVGQTIPVDKITTVNTTTRKLTVEDAGTMTANIIATIDFTLASGNPAKVKTLVPENANVQTSGGESINTNGVIVYANASTSQTTIQANNVVKTPGTIQSLYVSDVIELVSVYDFNGAAVANTGYSDITSRYTLNDGQKDSYYDHSSIVLKPGFSSPIGPLVVRYKRYSSSGSGFFSVDSYPTYETIPTFASPTTGNEFELRDSLDFRPVRKNATNALDGTTVTTTFDVDPTTTGPKIPEYGSDIIFDYSYYLPRIDKVILNKNRTFDVIQGIPSLTPDEPKNKNDSMNLYILLEPAYIDTTEDISVRYINNRRYTMRDIGAIEKRVENLEYYTSLSLLEQDAVNKQDLTILDSTNLPRFKNGIIVDAFKGHSVADVSSVEYAASIDPQEQELRPSFNISSRMLTFDSSNSSGYLQTGPFVTVQANNITFVNQPLASRTLNINPFNVVNFLGKIELNPKTDIWFDINRKADVLINIGGDQDAWDFVLKNLKNGGTTTEWNSWKTKWSGTTKTEERIGDGRLWQSETNNFIRTTETTKKKQTRTGVRTTVATETITQSIGDRIVDVSVIPYMREKSVLFTATDFKPDTVLYPFFDNTSVEPYVVRLNRIILDSTNLQYSAKTANTETIRVFNNITSTNNATAVVVKTSNNSIFIANLVPTGNLNLPNANVIGDVSGTTVRIAGYEHYAGRTNAATSTTITLALDASGANNEGYYANTLNSNTISVVSGTGAGQQRTISSYIAATRTATISTPWSTTPDANSFYSIGRLTTTRSGDVAGVFNIPTGTFRTGEKSFRLIDNPAGDVPSSSTNGDASFFAQGMLQTVEETFISTIQPVLQRTSVKDTRVTTTTKVTDTPVAGWWDPLAQTFLIAPAQYPQGIYVDSIRVCFKTKHDSIPVTLQLRPTVNGYPSSTIVYPYGSVTLTPDKVKVTDSPNLDDVTKYTEFVFDTPIYMLPGEHSFVLLSNSLGYEAYVGEVGKLDLVTGLQISEQPYGGSLFRSQNGSTWTPDEQTDMLFRINRKVFSTSSATAQFLIDAPSSNVLFDLVNTITSDIEVANTSINYSFLSERSTGGLTSFIPFNAKEDYTMYDVDGRRVLNAARGNTTFILQATMSTINTDISPVLDVTRFGAIFVDNDINNLPLLNSGFSITTSGSGYTANANVTISGGGGSGANAFAVANVTTGNITSIIVDVPGSGYTTSPTITIGAPPVPGGNTTSAVTYNGEDKKTGGNAAARYITRRVTLADGFDSGDLRVYLTAYKPSGSLIGVYYKLLSGSDSDVFDNKSYQLMTELGNPNFVSTTGTDYRELTFAPGSSSVANNSIVYTSGSTAFNSFKTFAIKIVMSGTDTTDVPKIRDLRVIALPAGT